MHYVIGDIHNDSEKFQKMLSEIGFRRDGEDRLYLLGDLFDRGGAAADPVAVYFMARELEGCCDIVEGNHDRWLAAYIRRYYALRGRARKRCHPYFYQSFAMLQERLTGVDMLRLAEWVLRLPLQMRLVLDGTKYLFAHAMTSLPQYEESDAYYLMGGETEEYDAFLLAGIDGYISFCGHMNTGAFEIFPGTYCDEEKPSIWRNAAGNVYMMDCGCGYADGRLACFCLETGERFYV